MPSPWSRPRWRAGRRWCAGWASRSDGGAASAAALLRPRSVAVLGASERSRWSSTAFDNLVGSGFDGAVHLVNPRGGRVHGRAVAETCAAIGEAVDLGVILVPSHATADALRDLGAAGARSAVMLTSGFAETGEAGAEMQREIASLARAQGIRLLGPNSLGFINFVDRAFVWTMPVRAPSRASGVAVIPQSGATAYFLSTLAYQRDVGLSHVVATGDEADLDFAAFARALVDAPETRALALFIETVRDAPGLLALAEAALDAGKPLVVLSAASPRPGRLISHAASTVPSPAWPAYSIGPRDWDRAGPCRLLLPPRSRSGPGPSMPPSAASPGAACRSCRWRLPPTRMRRSRPPRRSAAGSCSRSPRPISATRDIGGVALDLDGEAEVRGAWRRVTEAARRLAPSATIGGVLVAPMRARGIELFVGVSRDPQWGPVLAVGLGGIWVEVLQDVALRFLPVDAAEVRRMLAGLRGAKLPAGARGLTPADLDAVAHAVARIGDAALAFGLDLAALDVNPLWVSGDHVEALDALCIWQETGGEAGMEPVGTTGIEGTN